MKYGMLLFLFFASTLTYSNSFQTMLELQVQKSELMQELEILEKQNSEFIIALGKRESNMNPKIINPIGAMGAWQFMPGTLRDFGLGHITPARFIENPNIFPLKLQREVLERKFQRNLGLLRYQWFRKETSIDYLDQFIGRTIGGVEITITGILAACHIAGAGGVMRFLNTAGFKDPADMFGTRLSDYLREFANYEYTNTYLLKKEIQCLNDSLHKLQASILSIYSLRYYTSAEPIKLKDMVTVLTFRYKRLLYHQSIMELYLYPLELKYNYRNITGEFWHSVVPLPKITKYSFHMDMGKLSGIIRENGWGVYIQLLKQRMLKKERDYFNFISNQYGMLRGMYTFVTFSQDLNLLKWIKYPLIGADWDTQENKT